MCMWNPRWNWGWGWGWFRDWDCDRYGCQGPRGWGGWRRWWW